MPRFPKSIVHQATPSFGNGKHYVHTQEAISAVGTLHTYQAARNILTEFTYAAATYLSTYLYLPTHTCVNIGGFITDSPLKRGPNKTQRYNIVSRRKGRQHRTNQCNRSPSNRFPHAVPSAFTTGQVRRGQVAFGPPLQPSEPCCGLLWDESIQPWDC